MLRQNQVISYSFIPILYGGLSGGTLVEDAAQGRLMSVTSDHPYIFV
jgi:hypothetical protein